MAINSLTFDGVNSKDYGIYISGPGVFDAPARKYEMVSIPGRNGQYAIDEGTYDNIEVTYPAFVTDYTQYSFAERMSQIRNVFGSKSGYCRLYDSYNPDEFRLALFSNGVEVEPKHYNSTGEFNLIFNCKPQRYLVSGETPIEVTSGSKLVNPTYFDARPLIVVEADDDGIVYVNDKTISYNPESIGKMELDNTKPTQRVVETSGTMWTESDSTWTTARYNSGDAIGTDGEIAFRLAVRFTSYVGYRSYTMSNATLKSVSEDRTNQVVTFNLAVPKSAFKFNAGTDKTINAWFNVILQYETGPSSGTLEDSITITLRISHNASNDKCIAIEAYADVPTDASSITYNLDNVPTFWVDSSRAAFEGEVYFDTEACESYIYGDDGEIITINNVINTGPDYPKLIPGENGISFYGGINSCKFIPRWWTI